MSPLLRRLGRDERGNIVIETALALPVLLFILFATVDIIRYVGVQDDMVRAVGTSADAVGRRHDLSEAAIAAFLAAAAGTIDAAKHNASARMIVSAVRRAESGPATVVWQRAIHAGEPIPECSRIGAVGAAATLPEGFEQPAGSTVIVAEACYTFLSTFFLADAAFGAGLMSRDIYQSALSETRYAPLLEIQGS
jgi:hypothetical protein